MKKKNESTRLDDIQELFENTAEKELGDELRRLHLLLDLVCLAESQLPDNGPDELLGAALNLRDKVADTIARTIRQRIELVRIP